MLPVVRGLSILIVGAIVGACGGATTESPATAADQGVATSGVAPATATPPPGGLEPIQALQKMGAYLQTLKDFQIASDTTRDEVLADGQQVQVSAHVEMLVQRPNRLRVEITSDRQQRMLFYDGKSFTMWAQRQGFYATTPAPPTLAELAERLQTRYDIEVPLGDLLHWANAGHAGEIVSAIDVGPSQVGGVSCEHYAFRQADVDWQVWLQQGAYPLPRKIVITTTSDPVRPQYASVISWNLAPSFNDAAFVFEPPAGAQQITLRERPSSGS